MLELERRFQFLINKLENNTYYISEIIQNVNSTGKTPAALSGGNVTHDPAADYDSYGAAKYIIVVVLVYAFGILFFIGSQVRSSKKVTDEVDEVNAEKILRSMQTEIFTREVLEKLSDKTHREKAWNIYRQGRIRRASASAPEFICSETNMENIDRDAVENIQKKLKILNKHDKDKDKGIFEIESINEVFKSKFKNGAGAAAKKKKLKKSFNLRNFFKKRQQQREKQQQQQQPKQNNLTAMAPLLVLQTDDDGLKKLKESRSRSKKTAAASISNQSLNAPLTHSTFSLNSSSQNSTRRSINDNVSVVFDHCEISEQITTV